MNPIDRLADHLQAVYRDGGWSEVSVRGSFRALSAETAADHPIAGAHSAWELLLHLDAWHRAIARRLAGEAVELTPAEDWPPPPEPTDGNWQSALETLDAGLEELVRAVRGLATGALYERLPENSYTAFEAIAGIAEHDLYHAGQVILLSRASG